MNPAPPSLFRLSGGGNDFLALAEPEATPPGQRIRAWCRRGVSLGADGFFVLARRQGQVAMDYFNADGREAELCLNGTRCAAQLARQLGWCDTEVELLTGAGTIRGYVLDERTAALELPPPGRSTPCDVDAGGECFRGWFVEVGVPHLILPWDEPLGQAPLGSAGPLLRRHSAFGDRGANVSFVRYLPPDRLELRTFERGVEAETLACGTAVIAATAVGLWHRDLALPVQILTAGGFTMEIVAGDPRGDGFDWRLTGDARVVAVTHPLPASEEAPRPSAWSE